MSKPLLQAAASAERQAYTVTAEECPLPYPASRSARLHARTRVSLWCADGPSRFEQPYGQGGTDTTTLRAEVS